MKFHVQECDSFNSPPEGGRVPIFAVVFQLWLRSSIYVALGYGVIKYRGSAHLNIRSFPIGRDLELCVEPHMMRETTSES